MEFVSVVVGSNDVEEEDVLSFVVQTAQSELHLREHLPGRNTGSSKGDWLGIDTRTATVGVRTHKTVNIYLDYSFSANKMR